MEDMAITGQGEIIFSFSQQTRANMIEDMAVTEQGEILCGSRYE
jgi:hypothetical protein